MPKFGKFSGMGEASVSGGGKFFEPNEQYKVRIEKVVLQPSMRNKGQDNFIIECAVLESSTEKNPPGSTASQVINMNHQPALGNVKAFVLALTGIDPGADDANDQLAAAWSEVAGRKVEVDEVPELVIGDDQPFAGLEVWLDTLGIVTKEKKQSFTKHFWHVLGTEPDPKRAMVGKAAE